MKVVGFSNFAVTNYSQGLNIMSNIIGLRNIAKKAKIECEVIDGRYNDVVGDNIIFTPLIAKSFNDKNGIIGLDRFLTLNKNNMKYLFTDDARHL